MVLLNPNGGPTEQKEQLYSSRRGQFVYDGEHVVSLGLNRPRASS